MMMYIFCFFLVENIRLCISRLTTKLTFLVKMIMLKKK